MEYFLVTVPRVKWLMSNLFDRRISPKFVESTKKSLTGFVSHAKINHCDFRFTCHAPDLCHMRCVMCVWCMLNASFANVNLCLIFLCLPHCSTQYRHTAVVVKRLARKPSLTQTKKTKYIPNTMSLACWRSQKSKRKKKLQYGMLPIHLHRSPQLRRHHHNKPNVLLLLKDK